MARKLKVWLTRIVVYGDQNPRGFSNNRDPFLPVAVAAPNQKEAAAILRMTVGALQKWAFVHESSTREWFTLAMSKPGTVFYHDEYGDSQWHEYKPAT